MKITHLLALILSVGAVFANAQCVREDLKAYGTIKGKVVVDSESGEPVPGVSVSVSEDKYGGNRIASTTTDKEGTFSLPRVQPGKYAIAFRYPTFDPIITRLRVLKGKEKKAFILAKIAPPELSGSDSCEGEAEVVENRPRP